MCTYPAGRDCDKEGEEGGAAAAAAATAAAAEHPAVLFTLGRVQKDAEHTAASGAEARCRAWVQHHRTPDTKSTHSLVCVDGIVLVDLTVAGQAASALVSREANGNAAQIQMCSVAPPR